MSLVAICLACLLCLTCTAFAQDITSTPFANLTLIRQYEANFSSNVALPSFPCDSTSSGLSGGYQPLDLDDINTYYASQAVLQYFLAATANLTECEAILDNGFNISEACSQVVAGTNYALELEFVYQCLGIDDDETASFSVFDSPLRATLYLPLPQASSDLLGGETSQPVIKDIWFFMPPEVLAFNLSGSEAPAAAPASPSPAATSLLTDSSGVGTATGTLQFVASPAPVSPAAGSSPEPQPVTGLGVADQERSIAFG
ncbi:hypothetical protein ABBQ38_007879 [Trebouxia sp. C0009 RCD-2024]